MHCINIELLSKAIFNSCLSFTQTHTLIAADHQARSGFWFSGARTTNPVICGQPAQPEPKLLNIKLYFKKKYQVLYSPTSQNTILPQGALHPYDTQHPLSLDLCSKWGKTSPPKKPLTGKKKEKLREGSLFQDGETCNRCRIYRENSIKLQYNWQNIHTVCEHKWQRWIQDDSAGFQKSANS